MRKPLMIDLCCGSGGIALPFLEMGYDVIGFDIIHSQYPGDLVLADVRDLDGMLLRRADVIWASPPCEEFIQARYALD